MVLGHSLGGEASSQSSPEQTARKAGNPRVLIANEPRAYREVLGATLSALRPHIEFVVAEPPALDTVLKRDSPDMVVCSHVTPSVEKGVPIWIDLYPDGEAWAVICIRGRRSTRTGIELDDLLRILDRIPDRIAVHLEVRGAFRRARSPFLRGASLRRPRKGPVLAVSRRS